MTPTLKCGATIVGSLGTKVRGDYHWVPTSFALCAIADNAWDRTSLLFSLQLRISGSNVSWRFPPWRTTKSYRSGKRTTTVVPRSGADRMSSSASRLLARARILVSPNPSPLFSDWTELVEVPLRANPQPSSLILNTRLGGSQRRLTLMIVGWAWRSPLLIAS